MNENTNLDEEPPSGNINHSGQHCNNTRTFWLLYPWLWTNHFRTRLAWGLCSLGQLEFKDFLATTRDDKQRK